MENKDKYYNIDKQYEDDGDEDYPNASFYDDEETIREGPATLSKEVLRVTPDASGTSTSLNCSSTREHSATSSHSTFTPDSILVSLE